MRLKGKWSGTVSNIKGRSVLSESRQCFPLSDAEFTGEDGELIVYLFAGSPGLFNGDQQEVSCQLSDGTHLFLTNPSPTELHPSLLEETSSQTQVFLLGKDSILEYMPEPFIPFQNADYQGKTTVYMEEGSQAVIGDIVTAGRVGYGEIYDYVCFNNQLEVYREDELIVWDTFLLEPVQDLKEMGLMGNYTHMGTLWILSENITTEHLEFIQDTFASEADLYDCYAGASLLEREGMVIRLLGYSAQDVQYVIKDCWDYFRKQLFQLSPMEVIK